MRGILGSVLLIGGMLVIAVGSPGFWHLTACNAAGGGPTPSTLGLTLPIAVVQFCPHAELLFIWYYAGYAVALAGTTLLLRAALRPASLASLTVLASTIAALVPFMFSTDAYAYGLYVYEIFVMHVSPYAAHAIPATSPFAQVSALLPQFGGRRVMLANYGPYLLPYAGIVGIFSGKSVLATILAERLLGALCLIATGLLVAACAESGNRSAAYVWVALNPLLLLQSVSFAHGDAIMLMFLAAAYLAYKKGAIAWSAVFCVLAIETRSVALLGLAALLVELARSHRSRHAAFAAAAAAITLAGTAVVARAFLGTFTLGGLPTLGVGGAPFLVVALALTRNALSTLGYAVVVQAIFGICLLAAAFYARAYRFIAPAALAALPVVRAWYIQWLAPIAAITQDRALAWSILTLFALAPLAEVPETLNQSGAPVWTLIDAIQWGLPIVVYLSAGGRLRLGERFDRTGQRSLL
jgi:hypothetical protein